MVEPQKNTGDLATPSDYRRYFGVPPRNIHRREFVRWAQSICTTVTDQLNGTNLTRGDRDTLRNGLATALQVLSGDCVGAVLP